MVFLCLSMEQCFRCEKSGREIRIFDAIYNNETVKVCERCSILENIPLIKKPTTSQLRESESSQGIYKRLRRMAGLEDPVEKQESVLEQIRKLEEHPELEKPEEKKPFNLIDNFHWQVARARRNRGLSHRQLGWALGESETAIKMIEKSELPEDAEKLIKKLEQFFQIKLRERSFDETEEEEKKKQEKEKFRLPKVERVEPEDESEILKIIEPIKPIVHEPELNELDLSSVGERAGDIEESEEFGEEKKPPTQILSFKPEVLKNLTISDLKQIKEEKERQERLSVLEEERKNALKAQSIVRSIEQDEQKKREMREKIALEMKQEAVGEEVTKPESIFEKKEKLDVALKKISKHPEVEEKTPTISELMERKKEKEVKKLTGSEIELEEDNLSKI